MSPKRPQDLIFTLFGEYLEHLDRPVWVGSLIALLRPFEVSEGAVRTVLSRMVAKRWLVNRRVGRNSFYSLGARGRRIVDEGRDRIFHPPGNEPWDGEWCMAMYSVPEDVRHLRDRMRGRLAWLGFGSLGNGVWICPHDVEARVARLAAEMGLAGSLVCFRARLAAGTGDETLVARCWDLAGLADRYRRFVSRWEPELDVCRTGLDLGVLGDDRAFALRFRLIHEFRQFPMVDPFLPRELLPEAWPGTEASAIFSLVHDLLEPPSQRYVDAVLRREPAFARRRPLRPPQA